MMEHLYYICRGNLAVTKAAIQQGKLTVGFLGGSITDSRGRNRWSDVVCNWLVRHFPDVCISVENAAISATGSLSGLMHAQRSILDKHCDLVFVEYAVNDDEIETVQRMRSREGLIRKLVSGGCDVVCVYTFCQSMLEHMLVGELPPSILEFEQIAEHYELPGVFVGKYALDQVLCGSLRWEEWLPDGLHPENCGSRFYAEPVICLLEKMLYQEGTAIRAIPEPLYSDCWESVEKVKLAQLDFSGAWLYRNQPCLQGYDYVLSATSLCAELQFEFEGKGVVLTCNFGFNTCDFDYQIDGGEWKRYAFQRYDWMDGEGWPRTELIVKGMQPGKHIFRLRTVLNRAKGSIFEICDIGIV